MRREPHGPMDLPLLIRGMDDSFAATTADATERFHQKRDEIIASAARQVADRGLKGLTLVGVAQMVGLNTTSVTYYFRRKELLAVAAMEDALERFAQILAPADGAADPLEFLHTVLQRNFELASAIRQGRAAPLTILSDMRALDEPDRSRLIGAYFRLVAEVATRFGPATTAPAKGRSIARAQLFCDMLHWARSWLTLYSEDDFPRVQARLFDLLVNGLARPGAAWTPDILPVDPAAATSRAITAESYLQVATPLINERGYRGASVERIASQLKVSKGSFYHHLNGKDDLVLACFDRSYSRVSRVQHAAMALPGSDWQQLTSAVATLVDLQFRDELPLLRDTAMLALPEEMRPHVVTRSDRLARRFAGMISDGIASGTIRAVDPAIASQVLMGAINSAVDMAPRVPRWPSRAEAVRDYTGPLAYGFFS